MDVNLFDCFPSEVWLLILKDLAIKELVTMSEVSKQLNSIASREEVWTRKIVTYDTEIISVTKKDYINIIKFIKFCDLEIKKQEHTGNYYDFEIQQINAIRNLEENKK